MLKQWLSEKTTNIVSVLITTEADCNFSDGEYTAEIVSFIGGLDITSQGGVDDISLIQEAIGEIDVELLPKEGVTEVILEEMGEWEDVFWHKFYTVKELRNIAYNKAHEAEQNPPRQVLMFN